MDAMQCEGCGSFWYSAAAGTLTNTLECPACGGELFDGNGHDAGEVWPGSRSAGQMARLLASAYEDLAHPAAARAARSA